MSVAVFAGCDAALGIATGGVGAIAGAVACGALAGAAGNAVSYGITAAQTGKFSLSGLAESTAMGALAGGLIAGGRSHHGHGGAAATAEEGASAAAASGAEATATAAGSDTAASVAENTGKQAEDQALSCAVNSFTSKTRVLLAGGRKKAISKVRAGQRVLATDPYTHKTAARRDARVYGGLRAGATQRRRPA